MGLITQLVKYKDAQGRELDSYAANVLDLHDIRMQFRAKFNVVLSAGVTVSVNDNTMTITGANWEQYGAIAGATITGTIVATGGASASFSGQTILHVEADYMVVDDTLTDGTYNAGEIVFSLNPQAFELLINLVPSTETGSEFSLIDGNVNRFYVQGIDALTPGGSGLGFEQPGVLSGGNIIIPTIFRQADEYDDPVYEINIPDFVNYLYNNPEYFAGTDCVKFWVKASCIPVATNPAIRISTIHTSTTGNTGYLDESFNGFSSGTLTDPPYTLAAVDLHVAGDLVSVVDPTTTTNFQIKVNGVFTAGSKYGIAFWHTIGIDDDHFFDAHYENNTMLARNENLPNGASADIVGSLNSLGAGVVIDNVNISQTGGQATFTGQILPNSAFTTEILGKLEGKRGYKLCVKVENPTLTGTNIRPIWLTASEGQLTKYVPPLGPWTEAFGYTVKDHKGNAYPYVPGDGGLVAQRMITEDDVLVDLHLRVPRPSYQATTGETFTGLSVSIVAQKFTGERFELEPGIDITFADYDVINDAVDVAYSVPRGFKLPPTSDRNTITVNRYLPDDNANYYGLQIKYGVLMDWRYWLSEPNADSDFNGDKTKDWQHYQNGQWQIILLFELHTPDGSYVNDVNLNHETYNQWEGESGMEYFRMDGTQVTVPIEGEITRVVAKHRVPVGWAWNPISVWGMLTNEPYQSAFRWTTSTVLPDGGVVQNPFSPLPGEAGARLSFTSSGLPGTVANDVAVVESYFDPSKTSILNGSSFGARIFGEARKLSDSQPFWNRYKETVTFAKLPSISTVERLLKECCEPRKVIGDPVSQEKKYNDVTSHCIAGEEVEFTLLKGSTASAYLVESVPVPNANGWHSCTLSWHHIIQAEGPGCYSLMVTVNSAGVEITFKVETYELFPATRVDANGNTVPHENTIGDVCVTGLYNFNDVKNGLDMTDSNIVDSVRVKGVFGKYQPNSQIDNEMDGRYRKQKVVRQYDDEYNLKTAPISGKYMRLLLYILLHENECWVTDYNWENLEYYREINVIVSATPALVHEEQIARKVPVTCKFKDKLSNSISSYNNRNASKVPTVITIGGNLTVNGGDIYNSEGDLIDSFTGPNYILDDTTVIFNVNGVLNQSVTVPSMVDHTFNVG